MDTVISQLTLVIERELLSREKENTRIQVERERLKSTLLGEHIPRPAHASYRNYRQCGISSGQSGHHG